MKVNLILFFSILAGGLTITISQDDKIQSELLTDIPALEEFHEVIFPIWHEAYPDKNYQLLKDLLPEVNEKAELIYNAELPGILRDKKDKWNKGLESFKTSVSGYNKAVNGSDGNAMLSAAENLHSAYELLVRIIHPVNDELNEFHKDLYVIYHYYLPEKQYQKILNSSEGLLSKAEAVAEAKLSKLFAKAENDYRRLAETLFLEVEKLSRLSSDSEEEAIREAVENVHTAYQNLEALFN
ncbi:MAG: hypothetical protein Kow0098_25620 [Ignavibacteriaceae bacterium]